MQPDADPTNSASTDDQAPTIGGAWTKKDFVPLLFVVATLLAVMTFASQWFGSGLTPWAAIFLFAWLFIAMLWGAFSVVHHADHLAEALGEPYGTLILTLSVISIEVALIAAIMLTGDSNPTLARDTMFAVLMIVLNGFIGAALLLGALIYREQDYNLQGARAYLSVIAPLSVFSLLLPAFTTTTSAPTFSPGQAVFFAVITALLYLVFLAMQTGRHRGYFSDYQEAGDEPELALEHHPEAGKALRGIVLRTGLLLLTLVPILLLSKYMAKVVDFGIASVGAPVALGGIVIALIVLAPEGIAAMQAARTNHLQRSVNLLLGSGLSTIGLTVPAVLVLGLLTHQPVVLGLDNVFMVLLVLTLLLSTLTFGGARTNLLQGAVHLVIFLAYIVLIFSP